MNFHLHRPIQKRLFLQVVHKAAVCTVSPTRPSSLTTSTPSKYMSTFDKSDNSSSPEFSPNRSQNNTRNLVNDVDNSETGGFVSANTSVENSENERSGDPKKISERQGNYSWPSLLK